jgi:hypothetical protein
MLVADPTVCSDRGLDCFEDVHVYDEFLLDGPVTRRVAVLDDGEGLGAGWVGGRGGLRGLR